MKTKNTLPIKSIGNDIPKGHKTSNLKVINNLKVTSKKGAIAISQVLILLIAIFAFSFMIGEVNADSESDAAAKAIVDAAAAAKIIADAKAIADATAAAKATADATATAKATLDASTVISNSGNYYGENWLNFDFFSNFVDLPSGVGGWLNLFGTAAIYAAVAFAIGWVIGKLSGGAGGSTDDEFGRELGYSFGGGAFIGYIGYSLFLGPIGGVILGITAALAFFNSLSQEFEQRGVTFECKYWQPERGGENCELCNNQLLPCTEYQCKSLGGGCTLIDRNTEEPICVYDDTLDATPPEITPLESVLKDGYEYAPIDFINGVEIKYRKDNVIQDCLPEFKPFSFGIQLDKYGYCKLEDHLTNNFSEMRYDFGGMNYPVLSGEQWLKFPGTEYYQSKGITISNGGDYEYYVRCENLNGVSRDAFLFKFCINKGPDTTGPSIVRTTPIDGTSIRFFKEEEPHEIPVSVYTNEPAQCKWSHENKDYENMDYNLTCSLDGLYFNADLNYECSGTLTGMENHKDNDFYFNCKDTAGNLGGISTKLTLRGTEELVISTASPNNTLIKGSTDSIKVTLDVTTYAGSDSGAAVCGYSRTGVYNEYNTFYTTGTHAHSTDVYLGDGSYTYYLQCFDAGGNVAQSSISFDVEKDTAGVTVVRAFKEGNSLKIITDEEATCVYDTQGCLYPFEAGLAMSSYDELNHFTDWNSDSTLYIKCEDSFGNRPAADRCSIQAKAFEL